MQLGSLVPMSKYPFGEKDIRRKAWNDHRDCAETIMSLSLVFNNIPPVVTSSISVADFHLFLLKLILILTQEQNNAFISGYSRQGGE